jgi:hypothetical protein
MKIICIGKMVLGWVMSKDNTTTSSHKVTIMVWNGPIHLTIWMSMAHYSNPNSPLFGATWLKKFSCTWFLRRKLKIPCTKDVQTYSLKQH